MQRGFTKLFNTIVTSTIWREDNDTRILWITMLAIADHYGEVSGSIPGLAHIANISEEGCRRAITKLESPDPDSRTPDFEGRRIERIEGGWHILNYELYRKKLSADERREYKRIKQAEYRKRQKTRGKNVEQSGTMLNSVDSGGQNVDTVQEYKSTESTQSTEYPPTPLEGGSGVLSFRWPKWSDDKFVALFTDWQKERRAMGHKPRDWHIFFQRQLDTLSEYGPAAATAVVNFSLLNNYRGLLTPDKVGFRMKPSDNQQQKFRDIT